MVRDESDSPLREMIPAQQGQITMTMAAASQKNVSQKDVAEYINDLTSELAKMAHAARLDMLSYLLDMAAMESHREIKRGRPLSKRAA